MIENWLKPSDYTADFVPDDYESWQLGYVRRSYLSNGELPDLTTGGIALIGLDEKEADRVREVLYRMARPTEELRIIDLGNARKPDGIMNAPVMRELLDVGITPIFIGRTPSRCLIQYYGYHQSECLTNLVTIDDRIRFEARDVEHEVQYLDSIFDLQPVRLFHLAILGYQTHYNDPATLEYLNQHHFEFYRLGLIKYNIDECEPVLRDADTVTFHLSALKASDAPAQNPLGSSGLTSEEACQLCRFTGMADKVSSFGIYGYYADRDPAGQTADTVAQMLWYFIEGFAHRKFDFPVKGAGLSEFVVQADQRTPQIKFWKSERSGRWWMEIPFRGERGLRHHFVPCSYSDYLKACDQQLPDRLIEAYKRFS